MFCMWGLKTTACFALYSSETAKRQPSVGHGKGMWKKNDPCEVFRTSKPRHPQNDGSALAEGSV